MCFSLAASFAAAAITGTIGAVSMAKARTAAELPLAATPVVFAVQQGVEGLLWLSLPSTPATGQAGLAFLFLFVAEVFWPIYVPIAILLIEPSRRRRHLVLVCLAAGVGVGAYLFYWLARGSLGAAVAGEHIVYLTEPRNSLAVGVAYLTATSVPPLLSSRPTITALGVIVLVGSVAAYWFYWEAFISVWCFFAAAASVLILGHFERSRRQRLRIAGV